MGGSARRDHGLALPDHGGGAIIRAVQTPPSQVTEGPQPQGFWEQLPGSVQGVPSAGHGGRSGSHCQPTGIGGGAAPPQWRGLPQ